MSVPAARAKADVYAALADPTRRALLLRLAEERRARNVTELLEPFRISQPAISKHLRILREAGLVRSRKEGRMRLYELRARRLRQVRDYIAHFERFWDEKVDALGEYLDRQKAKRKSQ